MNPKVDYQETHEPHGESVETPVSVSHLVHTLRAYGPVIVLAMLAVAIGYTFSAILLYLTGPAQRTTVQPFRLEFRGAAEGTLPNGTRFSPIEIVGTPVLLKVYQNDGLGQFTKFGDFSQSIFIIEANRAYEKLAADYQARLSDPRLSPTDRDRLQKEFELKRESISKSDYAISYAQTSATSAIPETLTRKVLVDILNTWASFAINEQHALDYRVGVLSPQIIDDTQIQSGEPVIAIQILRSNIFRVIDNIETISALPAAELMRTPDKMSLSEIRMRLEDIVRFRLEPLVGVSKAAGLVKNPALTLHFLQTQLAYEQRRLASLRERANSARDALLIYTTDHSPLTEAAATVAARPRVSASSGETDRVVPQISDTFLDRLMTLTTQATDAKYRQKLIEEYRTAVSATVPVEQAVSYQLQVLEQMRSGGPSSKADETAVRAEIASSAADARQMVVKVNEIYQMLSRALNPSTQLFALAGAPVTRVERTRLPSRLALYGIVVLLLALPVVVVLCLLHNRIREEDAAAEELTPPTRIEASA
jgi:hypothetical protein